MVKFRIGKDWEESCPVCPRDTKCIYKLTETNHFEIGDDVYAVFETECEMCAVSDAFIWERKTEDGWVEVGRWTPDVTCGPTGFISWIANIPESGCFRVIYYQYVKEFSVGNISCGIPKIFYIGAAAIVALLLLGLGKKRLSR